MSRSKSKRSNTKDKKIYKVKLKRRYVPRSKEYSTFVGRVLESISDPYEKSYDEALDLCMRLNGYLLTIPQNNEELEVLDKVLWDFMVKQVFNNLTFFIEDNNFAGIWMETKVSEEDKLSERETFLMRETPIPNKESSNSSTS